MVKLVKVEKLPTKDREQDRLEGTRLQRRANAMLMRGMVNHDYLALRRAAEDLLGMWNWQAKIPMWKRVGVTTPSHLYPRVCQNIGKAGSHCAHLPAGSTQCRCNECPA